MPHPHHILPRTKKIGGRPQFLQTYGKRTKGGLNIPCLIQDNDERHRRIVIHIPRGILIVLIPFPNGTLGWNWAPIRIPNWKPPIPLLVSIFDKSLSTEENVDFNAARFEKRKGSFSFGITLFGVSEPTHGEPPPTNPKHHGLLRSLLF